MQLIFSLFFFPLIYPEIGSEILQVIFQKLLLKSLQGVRKDGVSYPETENSTMKPKIDI